MTLEALTIAPPLWLRPPAELKELARIVVIASGTPVIADSEADTARSYLCQYAALKFAEVLLVADG